MFSRHLLAATFSLISVCPPCFPQSATYNPLSERADPDVAAFQRWENARQVRSATVGDTRLQLPGLPTKDEELLVDAILRKHPRLLEGSSNRARTLILRMNSKNSASLRGIMAEAVFKERNAGWEYVSKPNASQHDMYRFVEGRRTPQTGQVKFHASGARPVRR